MRETSTMCLAFQDKNPISYSNTDRDNKQVEVLHEHVSPACQNINTFAMYEGWPGSSRLLKLERLKRACGSQLNPWLIEIVSEELGILNARVQIKVS